MRAEQSAERLKKEAIPWPAWEINAQWRRGMKIGRSDECQGRQAGRYEIGDGVEYSIADGEEWG